MDLIGFIRMLDQLSIFVALLKTDLPKPTFSRTIEDFINAALVEPSHLPGECMSGNTIQGNSLARGRNRTATP
jgi:hypothetical protein